MSVTLHRSTRWIGCVTLGMALIAGCGSNAHSTAQGPSPTPSATASSPSPSPTPAPTLSPGPPRSSSPTGQPAPTHASTPPRTALPPPPTAFPAHLAGTDWERIPTTGHVVALTFDAGANADAVPSILATLRANAVPATFFLTGGFVNQFPTAARQIAASARIGNHSMNHPSFTTLSTTQITAQLSDARRAIQTVTGKDPRPLFRFPYGDRNATTIAAVNAAGYLPVRWSVDTLGWKGTSGAITAQTVYNRALGALQPGEIILMHCGSNPTDHTTLDADALGRIIQAIHARGYTFTTLDALLN